MGEKQRIKLKKLKTKISIKTNKFDPMGSPLINNAFSIKCDLPLNSVLVSSPRDFSFNKH